MVNIPKEAVAMQENLIFSDSLKDLQNLRTQLYSAAEYFEFSYTNDDQKQIVVDTLKNYAIKALVNTVDHLGSATYKVSDFLDEKVDEVSDTDTRISCIEQRIRTCQQHIDREGRSQQSLVIDTPKYHKRYTLPVDKAKTEAINTNLKYHGSSLEEGDAWQQFRKTARATITRENPSSITRKGRSPSPSPRPLQRAATFLFNGSTQRKESEKRAASPRRVPLFSSGSLSSRPTTPSKRATTPNPSRPTTANASGGLLPLFSTGCRSSRPTTPSKRATTPNPSRPTIANVSGELQQYPSAPRKSASMRIRPEQQRESPKESEQQPSKSKGLLKSLLSIRKSKKDVMLYTYIDEY